MEENIFDLTAVKKCFSRVGLTLCVILVLGIVFQMLAFAVPVMIWGSDNWLTATSTGMWLCTFAPIYLIAIPVGLLLFRRIPAQAPQDNKLGMKNFLIFVPMIFCLTYAGNIIGNLLAALFSGGTAQNALEGYVMDSNPLKILVMVILAPLLEEYVFRKQVIDRTRQYGEKTAVFLSAITFGLFHMNLFQFFYAFAVGWILAYIYIRTGRIRYPVILHSIMNFMGSVLAPMILSMLDLEALSAMDPSLPAEEIAAQYAHMLPGLMAYSAYAILLLVMSVWGLVLLIMKGRKLIWKESESRLPQGTALKTVYLNVGMILFTLICLGMMVVSLM